MRHFFYLGLTLASFDLAMAETVDEEKADPISKTEFVKNQNALFSKADKNFDGVISFQELNVAEFKKAQKDSKERFKVLDINSNNFLSEEELILGHEEAKKEFNNFANRSKKALLKTYDLNGNGTITSDEIDNALSRQKLQSEKKSEREGKNEFKEIDKNGNGYVSVDEFVQNKTKFLNALLGNSIIGEYLTRDTNGDRVVNRNEHREFVEKLFLLLDRNSDDEISHAEQQSKMYTTFQTFDLTGVFTGMEQLLATAKDG